AIAKLGNIHDSSRIIFTVNGTEALNLGLKGILKPGDHVIISFLEHNSVNRPLHKLALRGVRVTRVTCDPRSGLDMDELSRYPDDCFDPRFQCSGDDFADSRSGCTGQRSRDHLFGGRSSDYGKIKY
ncbi:MAG: aminotransferase class V-fold PLP-dependent enzyme, partial [Deltaproteobacteria bacterium]|nr:aminotransferase class V-fold PLP-dependent enzyme [Deltaproteobacteria bacterium]